MLLPNNIHPSWEAFINEDIRNELEYIESAIGKNYNPINNIYSSRVEIREIADMGTNGKGITNDYFNRRERKNELFQ